jgi:hypothetical protein
MLDSVIQQFAGGDAGNLEGDALHGGLDALLGQAQPGHASGAVGEALQALGSDGFAQSVQSAAQNQGPDERGQVGSMLLNTIEQDGGNPGAVLSNLGIGSQSPQEMSHEDLGKLAGYVADNHGDAFANLLGNGAAGGGGGMESTALHLLGNPMVEQTATKLAQRFL